MHDGAADGTILEQWLVTYVTDSSVDASTRIDGSDDHRTVNICEFNSVNTQQTVLLKTDQTYKKKLYIRY